MRPLIVLAALISLAGCVSAPYVCQSTDPDICILETKLHAIKKAQDEAAFWGMVNGMKSMPGGSNAPRTHAEMMCAANPFEC